MAPTKNKKINAATKQTNMIEQSLPIVARKGLNLRRNNQDHDANMDIIQTRGKRKAEHSPVKNEKVKRSALGNLTNNGKTMTMTSTNKDHENEIIKNKANPILIAQAQILKDTKNIGGSDGGSIGIVTRQAQNKITTRAAAAAKTTHSANNAIDEKKPKLVATTSLPLIEPVTVTVKEKKAEILAPPPAPSAPAVALKVTNKTVRRISNEFNKTEESLYMSALEDISSCESTRLSGAFEAAKRRSALLLQQHQQCQQQKQQQQKQEQQEQDSKLKISENRSDEKAAAEKVYIIPPPENIVYNIPEDVEDFDKTNWDDPFQVSQYAMDIFNYLKKRESDFPIKDYLQTQKELSPWMRALLIDWMVEVQETFELNHETLYLAVKIVDLYLGRVFIKRDRLQLLGAAALFIACKYDERTPPLIDDFLYICDGAYKHDDLIKMEMAAFRTVNFDLGIPLSYRFLRRYARCAKIQMPTLTLARYILEMSLMDYDTIRLSDSKLACAALFIALRMRGVAKPWTPTLAYYSGYELNEFIDIVPLLNEGLHCKPKAAIKTIRSKYSHKIFYEVGKIKPLTAEKLLENNIDLNANENSNKITKEK